MEYSGAGGKLIHEKNQKQKISWHCPFKIDIQVYSILCSSSQLEIHPNPGEYLSLLHPYSLV